MVRKLQARLTYANVVATVALFLALGGGAYAAIDLVGRNDIKSKHIARGQVKSIDVANDSGKGALKAGDIADLHTGRKAVNDATPGDGIATGVTVFSSGGVSVEGGCRDNASNVGNDDVANLQIIGEDAAISLFEANTATEANARNGDVATLTVIADHATDQNLLNSGYFVAVHPDGNVVSGSVSVEVNDEQSTFDCIFAATGIG